MTPGVHELRFRFSRDFIRDALRRPFLWHAAQVLAAVMVLFAVITLVMTGGHVNALLLGVMAAGLAAIAARLVRGFGAVVDRTFEAWALQSPSHEMRFRLDRDALCVELEHAGNRYAWRELTKLWRYPEVWVLEAASKDRVLFPANAASDEIKAFLVECCRTAGVRVRT